MKLFWKKKKSLPEVPLPPKKRDISMSSSKGSVEEPSEPELEMPSLPSFEDEKLNKEELSAHNFTDMEMEAPPLPNEIIENMPLAKPEPDEFSSLFSQPLPSDNKKEFRKKLKQTQTYKESEEPAIAQEAPKFPIQEDLFEKGKLDESIFGGDAFGEMLNDSIKKTPRTPRNISQPAQKTSYKEKASYKEERAFTSIEDNPSKERELFMTMQQFKFANELSRGIHENSLNAHDALFRMGQITEDIATKSAQIQSNLENIHETLLYIDQRLFGR